MSQGGSHEKMEPWQPKDDLQIMELHRTIGPRWSTIAEHFPGRTIPSIRNRFLRLEAGKKLRDEGKETKVRCPPGITSDDASLLSHASPTC